MLVALLVATVLDREDVQLALAIKAGDAVVRRTIELAALVLASDGATAREGAG